MVFIFYFFALLLILAGVYFFLGAYRLIVKREILFVPTANSIISALVENMDLRRGDIIYDLGCGDGRILIALAKREKEAKYVGIERDIVPYFLFKLRLLGKKLPIEVRRSDFFAENVSDATHIVMYLIPTMINRVAEKITRESKIGTRLFSVDFPIHTERHPRIRPLSSVETGYHKRKIYRYVIE